MKRSEKARVAWRRLSPNQRRILVSHRPDEMEQEESLRASVLTALSSVYGPVEYSAAVATVAEGERDGSDSPGPEQDYAASLDEIAIELGVHKQRVREIQEQALRKLRKAIRFNPWSCELADESDRLAHRLSIVDSVLAELRRRSA